MDWDIDTPDGMRLSKQWLESLIKLIAEGGIWGVPRSQTMYRIYKSKQLVERYQGPGDPAIERVFKAINWTVKT